MSMTTELELALREKFEAWAEECCALPWGYLKKRRTYSGHYSEHTYTSLWGAWKAACEGMVEALEARDKQIAELTEARDLFNSKMMGFAYRVEELEARTVKLPESFYPDGDIDCPLAVNLEDVKAMLQDIGVAVEGESS